MLRKKRFTVCVDNKGYKVSLILKKIYEIIPDERAEQDDFVRVIDKSGEDYLYNVSRFVLWIMRSADEESG
ncbi:MAG TPA: hypothetical protein VFD70_08720 [Anaerolineae bacterium]|nr:hypothetical protein [Anaerolineae bacterium]